MKPLTFAEKACIEERKRHLGVILEDVYADSLSEGYQEGIRAFRKANALYWSSAQERRIYLPYHPACLEIVLKNTHLHSKEVTPDEITRMVYDPPIGTWGGKYVRIDAPYAREFVEESVKAGSLILPWCQYCMLSFD